MSVMLYFIAILLTCVLSGFLAAYAWRHRSVPGARAYAGLALSECFLALVELISMLSPTPALALFWFRMRAVVLAIIPVFWLVFALEYSGRKHWLSKGLLAGLFVIPAITQAMHWTNQSFGLWVKHEEDFQRSGPFWIAITGARVPAWGFLTHAMYGLLLQLIGVVLLLTAAWRMRRQHRRPALLVAAAGCVALVTSFMVTFNLLPRTPFNPFTPGIGLSVLLIALAAFRFQFLKHAPAAATGPQPGTPDVQAQRSMVVFILIFAVMATGIAAAGILSYRSYESQFRTQMDSQLESIASLKVDGIEAWRAERLGDAETIRQSSAFAALAERFLADSGDAEAQAQLQAWLAVLYTLYRYDRVSLLDARGIERLSVPTAPGPVAAHLSQEVNASLSTGQVTFLDLHRDAEDDPIHLSLLAPIFAEPDHRPLGVVVLRIDPNTYLYPFIQQWPIPSASAETLLVRRDGTDVLYLNDLRDRTDAALNLRIPLTNTQTLAVKAALDQEGLVEGVDFRGVPSLGVARAVPGSPWTLVARIDAAEVYAPLRARSWQTTIFLAALILAAGAALGFIWRQQRMRAYRAQAATVETLRETRDYLDNLIGYANAPIITWDTALRITRFNHAFERLTGYAADEVMGQELSVLFPAASREAALTEIAHASEGEFWESVEIPIQRQDGETRVVLWNSANIYAQDGTTLIATLAQGQDITERKQAEKSLRESETRFRTLFEQSAVGVALLETKTGQYVHINQKYCDFLGYTLEEMLCRKFQDVTYPDDVQTNIDNNALLIAGTTKEFSIDKRYIRKDGTLVWGHLTASPLWRPGEKPQTYFHIAVVQGITERKQAEESLRASEVRYRRLFEAALDGILLLDAETARVVDVNPHLTELLGLTRDQFLGRAIWELGPFAKVPASRDRFAQMPREGSLRHENLLLETAAGCRIEVEFESNVYQINNHKVIQCNIRDITERRQAEAQVRASQAELQRLLDEADLSRQALLSVIEDQRTAEEETRHLNAELEQRVRDRTAQLESANKELESFAYSVSHDLRAPLRGIDGWSQALMDDYGSQMDEQARQYLGRVRTEAQRMGQLIDALLQLSRVTRAGMQRRPVDLSALAQIVVNRLREAQPERQVAVVIQPDLLAQGDTRLLEVVLTNLLGNAWKFTGARPLAHIEFGMLPDAHPPVPDPNATGRTETPEAAGHADTGETAWTFFVRDDGAGFDMTYAHNLFGAFQRLHKVAEFPGTGIGLATVQRIIHRHGGRTWAEAAVDQGATFYFTLPA